MTDYYLGRRGDFQADVVAVDEMENHRPLAWRLDLSNHSPTGFEWGYAGSGPAQLALAILADALGDDARALRLHQRFKAAFIQNLSGDEWTIRAAAVRIWATTMGAIK